MNVIDQNDDQILNTPLELNGDQKHTKVRKKYYGKIFKNQTRKVV